MNEQALLQMIMGGGQSQQVAPEMVPPTEAVAPEANKPQLYESPLFQRAVERFIELNGVEPATDSDFEGEGGVLDLMMELRNSNQNETRGRVLKQVEGEE